MRGIIDSTLREGEQQAHLYFSTPQKFEIINLLQAVGVEEIELGIDSADSDLGSLVEAIRDRSPRPRIAIWCRFREDDILKASSFCPDLLSIALPVSDLHLGKRLRQNRDWAIRSIKEIVQFTQRAGVQYVSLGLEDCTRASLDFLDRVVNESIVAGCDRIRLGDTLGVAAPTRIEELVKRYRGRGVEIAVHTHDDFGMATANAVTALDNGADWADASVLGVGERAGIAKLEVLLGFLNLQRNISKYNLHKLKPLMDLVAFAAGETIQRRHPVFGDALFECETGLHLDALAKDAATYEPFPPEAVGSRRARYIGMKAGRNAVVYAAAQQLITIAHSSVDSACAAIRSHSRRLGRHLTEDEFGALAQRYAAAEDVDA